MDGRLASVHHELHGWRNSRQSKGLLTQTSTTAFRRGSWTYAKIVVQRHKSDHAFGVPELVPKLVLRINKGKDLVPFNSHGGRSKIKAQVGLLSNLIRAALLYCDSAVATLQSVEHTSSPITPKRSGSSSMELEGHR